FAILLLIIYTFLTHIAHLHSFPTRRSSDHVFYLKTLKAPIPRNQDDPVVLAGKALFENIQCAACHKPTLTTGYSPIEAISFKELDRKSTRLNSSHVKISYAVFCWKKKTIKL